MYLNAALEREVESKSIDFTPENFENIEIDSVGNCASGSYSEAVDSLFDGFREKKWFKEKERLDQAGRRKLICIIGPIDASLILAFQNYADDERTDDYVFKYLMDGTAIADVLQADIVIGIRYQVFWNIDWPVFCKKLGIPYIYYSDDNFHVLARNHQGIIAEEGERWTKERFELFSSVIVTSKALKEYIVDKFETDADKTYFLPCMPIEKVRESRNRNQVLTFAFLGGPWRNQAFIDEFLPYIRKISRTRTVRLICADDKALKEADTSKIEVIFVHRRANLTELLREVRGYQPDFLIHCGNFQENNAYKTPNSLWNSLVLGSVLIVNDIQPYNEGLFSGSVAIANTGDDFEELMETHGPEDTFWDGIYEQAKELVEEHYCYSLNDEVFHKAFHVEEPVNHFVLAQRLDKYMRESESLLKRSDNGFAPGTVAITRRKVVPEQLRPSRPMGLRKKYFICSNKDRISGLSVIFTSYQQEQGSGAVVVNLIHNGNTIRTASRRVEDIIDNFWTDFSFDTIEGCLGKHYEVEIAFYYSGAKKQYVVYEYLPNVNFTWRAFNRLGLQSRKENVLFFDLQ